MTDKKGDCGGTPRVGNVGDSKPGQGRGRGCRQGQGLGRGFGRRNGMRD